ncbi:MAG: laccase domain-containing protein [Patescibacteria group bacterium]
MLTNAKTMLRTVSENGRATFSCVPRPARTVGKSPEERLELIRQRVGSIVQIYCDFLEGDVYLPNPAKHTDRIETVEISSPENAGWSYATRENSVSFYDRKPTETDSGHCDSVILLSEKPLKKDVGIFIAPADCAIVGLSHRDPNVDFAALIHSGWKGTAKDVVGQTVEKLKIIFGNSVTGDLEAFISPFAKSCCYEFGADTFSEAFMQGRIPEGNGLVTLRHPLWHKLGIPRNS